MYDYHIVLGALGVIVGFIGYVPYFRDIAGGTTKPHVFTWFGWGLINAVAFAAQLTAGAGAGLLVTGFTSLICFTISGFALFRGEKNITKSDWMCLTGSLLGILMWVITNDPLLAVIIITVSDALAFIPTIRKAYYKPDEETASSYAIATFRSLFGLLALQSLALTNWLYLASILLSDGGFAIMLLFRRRQLAKRSAHDTMSRNG